MRLRYAVAMGVLVMSLLILAAQCPNTNSRPVAVFSADPTSGPSPLTVNFDASSSVGRDGSILAYAWSFGDGDTGTGETISHTYRQPGIYTAQLTVTNQDGNMDLTSCTITVTAAVGTSPSASFTATPSSGKVPLAVTFNASSSSDSDGFITLYDWVFGDGRSESGVIVTHTYTSAGTYTARLTVTDDDGATDTTTTQIEVSAASVPGDLYVDASSGSNVDGNGSQANPYKTITEALNRITPGEGPARTIHVAAGVYSTGLGEESLLEMIPGTSLVGEGATREDVKIAVRVICKDNATLENLTCYQTLEVSGAGWHIRNLSVEGTGSSGGIRIYSPSSGGVIQDCTVNHPDSSGIYIISDTESDAPMVIERCTVESQSACILIQYATQVVVRECSLTSNWAGIVSAHGGVIVDGNTFFSPTGVEAFEAYGNTEIVVSRNVFANCQVGVDVRDSVACDLGEGVLGSAGLNDMTGVDLYGIKDQRTAYSGAISAKNNTWDDPQPLGTVSGPVDSPPNYFISNEGNSIIFSN